MAVVVNDFEVVSSEPTPARGSDSSDGGSAKAPSIELNELARVLRALDVRTLRVWAH